MSATDQQAYDLGYRAGITSGVSWAVGTISEIANDIAAAGNPAGASALLKVASRVLDEFRFPGRRVMHPEDIGLTPDGRMP